MSTTSKIQIVRPGFGGMIPDRLSVYTDINLTRGQAVMRDTSDTTPTNDTGAPKIALATLAPIGIAVRDVDATGATLIDSINPFPAGKDSSRAHAYANDKQPGYTALDPLYDVADLEETTTPATIADTSFFVTSGTGAITSGASLGAKLEFYQGRLRLRQSTNDWHYRLSSFLTAEQGAGFIRILVERNSGFGG